MSSRMRRFLWIIGIILVVLVVLIGVGYLTLVAKPLKPPQYSFNIYVFQQVRWGRMHWHGRCSTP